jgi:serpin B
MNRTASLGYLDTPALQILELKYGRTSLVFDVLLPKKVDGLAELERSMTPAQLEEWLRGVHTRDVKVSLPRFRVEAEFSLKQSLSRLGMPSAFGDGADFSGIDGRRDMVLADVKHKAFVDVNEEGTEAAAATGVAARLVSFAGEPPVFRADHPFLFLVRDTASGVILFAGRLATPGRR